MLELVNEAISLGRDGVASMEISDAFDIIHKLENGGNYTEMGLKLSYKIKKYREQKQRDAMQMQQLQAQQTQQLTAQKQQGEAQLAQQEAQVEMGKIKTEKGYDMQMANFDANKEYKLKLMELADNEKDRELQEKLARMPKQNA